MLDRMSSKPLHLQMEELIRSNLQTGAWASDAPIPSENELAKEYGVSRMTVRSVVIRLCQEGLMYRIPGKGTYVAEPKIEAKSLSYAGIREQLEQQGYEVTTQIISLSMINGSADMCERFQLPPNSMLFELKRLRSIKSEPFSLHTSYMPYNQCPDLSRHDLANEQLCDVLSRHYGLNRSHTKETLESVVANEEEAFWLKIKTGHPLLLLKDTIVGENGRPYEYARVVFRGEKMKLSFEF